MDDFLLFILEFHEIESLEKCINNESIVLIPERDNPIKSNDFRPISLDETKDIHA